MATFGLTSQSNMTDIVGGLNYALSAVNSYGNAQVAAYLPTNSNIIYLNNNAIQGNATTGIVRFGTVGNILSYLYQYISVAYADDSSGGGFSFSPTNKEYYGIRNSPTNVVSTNPADYVWFEVAGGGFGTTKFLWYISYGGNTISYVVSTTKPGATYNQVPVQNNVDLNVITSLVIPDDFITAQNILNNAITGAKIQLGTITGNLVEQQTLTGNLIALQTITGNLIATDTIFANSIVGNSITSTQLQTGLLLSGNVVSFNANIGDINSPGYWLRYDTGDASFAGNVDIAGVLTTNVLDANVVNTTQIVQGAVTNSVFADYGTNYIAPNLFYKIPKLVNYNSYYWTANTGQLLLSATITPTSTNSTIVVNYDVYYSNDTGTTANSYVELYRSQNEGVNNPGQAEYGGNFYPQFKAQFRKVKYAFPDPNGTSPSIGTNAYPIITGFQRQGIGLGTNAMNGVIASGVFDGNGTYTSNITLGWWSNFPSAVFNKTIVPTNSYVAINGGNVEGAYSSNASVYQINASNVIYYSYGDASDFNQGVQGVASAYYFNGNVNTLYPSGYQSFYQSFIQDTNWEPWGRFTGAGTPTKKPYLAITNKIFDVEFLPYDPTTLTAITQITNVREGGQILFCSDMNATGNVANLTLEPILSNNNFSTQYGLNSVSNSIAPYNTANVGSFVAVAVGDYGTIFRSTRSFSTDGDKLSGNVWVREYWYNQSLVDINGAPANLYCVSHSTNNVMNISSLSAGAGADAGSANSNTFVAVGERGATYVRESFSGRWWASWAFPPNLNHITLRGVCYDAYRYRWWAVGDAGTILWANDKSGLGNAQSLVWSQYNSGTLRNLYSIAWDPITAEWTAVGDGIVITDDGTTLVNGQRSYPINKAFAYDAVSNYSNIILNNYEPVVVQSIKSQVAASVVDWRLGFNQTANTFANMTQLSFTSSNVQLQSNTVVSGQYIEQTSVGTNQWVWTHTDNVPITFFLVVGAGTTGNAIISNPTLTITEFKR